MAAAARGGVLRGGGHHGAAAAVQRGGELCCGGAGVGAAWGRYSVTQLQQLRSVLSLSSHPSRPARHPSPCHQQVKAQTSKGQSALHIAVEMAENRWLNREFDYQLTIKLLLGEGWRRLLDRAS